MKKLIFYSLLFFFSCGKNGQENVTKTSQETAIPPYDTIAKDSFSAGAISVDVARQIRISSKQYQDSLAETRKKQEEERLLKLEKEKADKKLAEEKKKAEDAEKAKKEKENKPIEPPVNENPQNPQ